VFSRHRTAQPRNSNKPFRVAESSRRAASTSSTGITRYSWDAVDADGNTVSDGLDVVEHNADGRLRRIVMFHDPLPNLE